MSLLPAGYMQLLIEWDPPVDAPEDARYMCIIAPETRPGPWQEAINNTRLIRQTSVVRQRIEAPSVHVEVQMVYLDVDRYKDSSLVGGDFAIPQ